jgi:hypothetical protein
VHRDRSHDRRGDDPDLRFMAGQRGARRTARSGRHGGKAEVGRRDAHPRGNAHPGPANDRGLDQQQADHANLHRDGEPGDESGEERCARVHAHVLTRRTATTQA